MQWTRVILPEVFEEFELVYILLLLFSFHYHCQLVTGQLKQKSGEQRCSTPVPRFLGAWYPAYRFQLIACLFT